MSGSKGKESDTGFRAVFRNGLDAQFIVDMETGRILDANKAAQNYLDYRRDELLKKRFTDLIPPMPDDEAKKTIEEIRHFGGVFTQEFLKAGGEKLVMDMTLTMIPWDDGQAFIATLRDVSERLAFEQERETLIEELQEALDKIKTLKGLLPICAKCKKIRDDNGYWQQLETFIHAHSEADFTHGICPDCAKELYPGIYDEVEKDLTEDQ